MAGCDLAAPQYLLLVDSNPNVQVALLFWVMLRLVLVGASPVSTGGGSAGAAEPPARRLRAGGRVESLRRVVPVR